MKWLRKPLIWTHRYLGMALSLLFLMWFLTGIGMMYSRGMPRLTPEMRLSRLAPLDLQGVQLSPSEAASRAGLLEQPRAARLLTLLDRPAYRFEGRTDTTVFADTGEIFLELTLEDAIRIASRFLDVPSADIRYGEVLTEPDQWTMTLGRQLPMYKLLVDDGRGTQVYVAARAGEVVQLTTRRGRALAWVSVIPHFMYFRALRLDLDLWNSLMVWGPGLGLVVAIVGLVLGVVHLRPSRPIRLGRFREYIPYRGWLRWHTIGGLAFGALTVTFVGSGLLSMEPWGWTMRDDSLQGATSAAFPSRVDDLGSFDGLTDARFAAVVGSRVVKEVELTSVMGQPHLVARGAPMRPVETGWPDGGHQPYFVERARDAERLIVDASLMEVRIPLETTRILSVLEGELPGVDVIETSVLDAYDSYYYSREGRSPLPVVRIKLDDADHTWLYIDPDLGRVVGRINRVNRLERWLYAGLHTFDFPFLYDRRPLWDAVILVFCLGGAFISGLGFLMSVRRVTRTLRRRTALAGA